MEIITNNIIKDFQNNNNFEAFQSMQEWRNEAKKIALEAL